MPSRLSGHGVVPDFCVGASKEPSPVTSVPGRAKPTVPQNMRGTLTLSDNNSAHTLRFIIILYESCNRASFKHLGQLPPINYVYIVAFAPNLQRASFYSVTEFLPYSTAIKLLPLHNTHERSYRALEPRYNAKKFSSALCLLSRTNSYKAATPVGTSD